MSLIDNENYSEMQTTATLDRLAIVLENEGYKVTKSSKRILASHGGVFSSYKSIINVLDLGEVRTISDTETSKGYMLRPKSDRLARIVMKAEED